MSDVPSGMLRQTLRDGMEPPSSGCVDAETLAAWSEGTLRRRDRAAVEAHAATCSRCQTMLAAMAKTTSPLPTRKWWQTSAVRWLVPIATVSTIAVVVWMNAPSERLAVPAPRLAVPTSPIPAPVSVPEARTADVTAPKSKSTKPTPQPAAAPTEPSGAVTASAPPPAAADQLAAAPVAAPAPPPPPPAPAPRSIAAPSAAENVVILPRIPIVDRQSARSVVQSAIQSSNQDARWRIVGGTIVERSTDGGTSWQTQTTASGRLVTGFAPSATVCWLVGSGGAILLSTDGQTWQRVAFPEAIDLTAIVATDALHATVTTADGRTFGTTDGGKTWAIVSSR